MTPEQTIALLDLLHSIRSVLIILTGTALCMTSLLLVIVCSLRNE